MAFPSTVSRQIGLGVIGSLLSSGPSSARVLQIASSGTPSPNRIGRVFTRVAGSDSQATIGGTPASGSQIAGLLIDPKLFPGYGVPGNTLGATLDLPQGTQAAFLNFSAGPVVVYLEGPGNIGDPVDFDTTTGQLWPRSSGSVPAGRANYPNMTVDEFTLTAAGLGCVRISV